MAKVTTAHGMALTETVVEDKKSDLLFSLSARPYLRQARLQLLTNILSALCRENFRGWQPSAVYLPGSILPRANLRFCRHRQQLPQKAFG